MSATASSLSEKSARLSCRIRPSVKAQTEAAARLLGQSVTDFAEAALEEKARAVIAENERVVFSDRAFSEFVENLSRIPDKPSEKLLAAVAAYNRHETVVKQRG